jgi:hypothetical protein
LFVDVWRRDLWRSYSFLTAERGVFPGIFFIMHTLLLGEGPGNFRAKVQESLDAMHLVVDITYF